MKNQGVMCCGCYRMMAPDGNPLTGMRPGNNGVPEPIIKQVNTEDIAWFASKTECDEAAVKFGWRVEDREGPNHRCPDCIEAEHSPYAGMVTGAPRGAYVSREDLGL
jgi:hypothetical protein